MNLKEENHMLITNKDIDKGKAFDRGKSFF